MYPGNEIDTVNGTQDKSIESKEGDNIPTDGSPNNQSMTQHKHKRNTEAARARAAELIEIHGSEALNLGVDAVVEHLLQRQTSPGDSNSLPGHIKIGGTSAYQFMKYIRISSEEDRQKMRADEKARAKEARRIEEERRTQINKEKAKLKEAKKIEEETKRKANAEAKEARRLKQEQIIKDQADYKAAERAELDQLAADRRRQKQTVTREMDNSRSTSGNVIKDLTPKHRLHDGLAPGSIDWSPQYPRLSALDISGDEAVSTGINTSINEASSIRRTSPSSVRSTTDPRVSPSRVAADSIPTMATHVDQPTKTLGRFRGTDINPKTGHFFTKEDWDIYQ